jgi:molecular chaperone DnaK
MPTRDNLATFIGIDLGTTNSTLAVFDGDAVAIVATAQGEPLTPSVVRLLPGGAVAVGRKAARFLDRDPANTRAEFKRLMGTAERLPFEAAGQALLPEELSAHVLASLLADARDALGFSPRAAVISTPALFELPQNHATMRAGKLAGLEEVVLIQEPIASAIAAGWHRERQGTWLVFDLGGGTLDVSLLETKDGRLRVVDHSGDNFLGGKDIDQVLVDWAVTQMAERCDRGRLEPTTARGRRMLAKLKAACEQAKIELSRADCAAITVPDLDEDESGNPVDLDLPIQRTQLEGLLAPIVDRSLAVVRGLLARNRRPADQIERVVLVGGPTLTPRLRGRIGELFGDRLAEGIEPMTLVARGAALYAATAGLDARPKVTPASVKAGLALRIEHPPVTADLEPFVVGRFLPGVGTVLPDSVRIERDDGGCQTPAVKPSAEGSFVLQVKLLRHRQNGFHVAAVDDQGHPVPLATSAFTIVHGLSVADPPLARTIGVACADDTTQPYFVKGTPLPARRTLVHVTVKSVSAGSQEDALHIPVVQGDSYRAHRNRLVGMLQLRGVHHDLPAGSRVEITLHLDRSGQLSTRADIPAIGQTFEEVATILVPSAPLATVERELAAAHRRIEEVRRRAFQAQARTAVEAVAGVTALLAEAEGAVTPARNGDADAAQKLQRLLLDVETALDDAEAIMEWPDLEREARRCTLFYTPIVAQWGTAAEQGLYDQVLQAATQAERTRDARELERQLQAMRSLGKASYWRNPQSAVGELEWMSANLTQTLDVARANHLLEEARAAQSAGNEIALRAALAQLGELFPSSSEEQDKSYGSGVR